MEYQQEYFYYIYNKELERQLSKVASNKYIKPVVYH